MFIDITCSTCGENSRIRAADKREIFRCPGCGRSFEPDSNSSDPCRWDDLAIDDAVVGWIVRSPGEPTTEPAEVDACFSCGYEGSMPYDSEHGIAICPACSAVRRDVPEEIPVVVDCPQCGQPIDVFERDRGKTTVCPHCKYFLGCVLQSAKRRFAERRFLGFRLSQREKTTV
jgi:predicted RNA-binding Zn-ribbon protein involved in translation (DUF1610 family)